MHEGHRQGNEEAREVKTVGLRQTTEVETRREEMNSWLKQMKYHQRIRLLGDPDGLAFLVDDITPASLENKIAWQCDHAHLLSLPWD